MSNFLTAYFERTKLVTKSFQRRSVVDLVLKILIFVRPAVNLKMTDVSRKNNLQGWISANQSKAK